MSQENCGKEIAFRSIFETRARGIVAGRAKTVLSLGFLGELRQENAN
jgi:hypothetical protein